MQLNLSTLGGWDSNDEENLCVPPRNPLHPLWLISRSLRLKVLSGVLLFVISSTVWAQRKPIEAARLCVVMSAQSVEDMQKILQPDNKTSELIDSAGM